MRRFDKNLDYFDETFKNLKTFKDKDNLIFGQYVTFFLLVS